LVYAEHEARQDGRYEGVAVDEGWTKGGDREWARRRIIRARRWTAQAEHEGGCFCCQNRGAGGSGEGEGRATGKGSIVTEGVPRFRLSALGYEHLLWRTSFITGTSEGLK
jgi:hypothetical protein